MRLIDVDKFLTYLIYSKHIDSLTCGEVKEAIEMCEINVLDEIRAEIKQAKTYTFKTKDGQEFIASADDIINPDKRNFTSGLDKALEIIDKYKGEQE